MKEIQQPLKTATIVLYKLECDSYTGQRQSYSTEHDTA
jgi:hypothetical protein